MEINCAAPGSQFDVSSSLQSQSRAMTMGLSCHCMHGHSQGALGERAGCSTRHSCMSGRNTHIGEARKAGAGTGRARGFRQTPGYTSKQECAR
jgi:hypothetical protein